MNTDSWIEGSMTIGGREIQVRHGVMQQSELLFYEDNPRVYSIVHGGGDRPSQAEIERRLSELDHVKRLIQSIRENGGLIDPLFVRRDVNVVLEGNSRLAAYRALAKMDPIKWGYVKVTLLPKDVSEDLVFAILGHYHIVGRQDWAPYEQAGYLHRMINDHGISAKRISLEMGMTANEVNRLVNVYEFMLQHGEDDINRWSYYEEYLRSRVSKKARDQHPNLDRVVVEKIRSGEIERAIDVRTKLIKVLKGGDKSIKILTSGSNTIERALDSASARGVDNPWLGRLNRFRIRLAEESTVGEFQEMNSDDRKKAKFEMNRIERALKSLRRELD